MRSVFFKLVLGLGITAMAAFGADNTVGSWKLNMDKSKFTTAAPVKSLTITREASDGGIKVSTTGDRADGTKSSPDVPNGWQRRSLPIAIQEPRRTPCTSIACIAYSEQVGR